MSNELNDIQNTILEIYTKNINFFRHYDPILYDRINQCEEKEYFIDYIDNHFELVDSNNTPIYNCDPFYDAQYRADSIQNNESMLQTIDISEYHTIKSNEKFDIDKFLNEYIELIKNHQIDQTHIEKFMFIGTLLGAHLTDISRVINASSYFIYEKNLEIFRLSLFLTDYEEIAQNATLYFSIALEEQAHTKVLDQFLEDHWENNYAIKFELANVDYVQPLENILNHISHETHLLYTYEDYLKSFKYGIRNFLHNKENGIIKTKQPSTILSNKPILFLGSGPSLEQEKDFLIQNQDSFIIVTAVSTLKFLDKNNIIPDIIITLDNSAHVTENLNVSSEIYQDSLIFASINTDSKVFDKLQNQKLFLVPDSLELFHEVGYLTGSTVGDVGLKLLLNLGANDLYLLGIDAALNQKSGATHNATHISHDQQNLELTPFYESENIDFYKTKVKVKGNFTNEVVSTLYFKDIIEQINSLTTNVNKNVSIYNLSHGAYFENTIALKSDQCNVGSKIEKSLFKKSFVNEIRQCCIKSTLNNLDIESLNIEKQICLDLLQSNDLKSYQTKLKKINQKNQTITQILEVFYKNISSYIGYIQYHTTISTNEIIFNQIKIILEEYLHVIDSI